MRKRKLAANEGPQSEAPDVCTVQRIQIDQASYELRYVKCGARCSRCAKGGEHYDPMRPGHGPYWYRHYRKANGQSGRRYIGKQLTKR
jgi:hypothetical protein